MIERRQLAVFLVGSVALGSLATAALAGSPVTPEILGLVAIPISYIPAALAVLMLAGVASATMRGGRFPFRPEGFALLPLFLITNLGEEIGWRGYALPLLQRHLSSLSSSVVLGGGWAAFHWVALGLNPSRPWGYLAVGSVSLIAMSVLMTWLFNRTSGSVALMVTVHTTYDVVSIAVVPLIETAVPLLAFTLSGALLCLLAVVLGLRDGPELRSRVRAHVGDKTPQHLPAASPNSRGTSCQTIC